MPGDVVKFADPQKGKQKGFVSNMEVIGAIKILSTNLVLQNVDCKELMPLQVCKGDVTLVNLQRQLAMI